MTAVHRTTLRLFYLGLSPWLLVACGTPSSNADSVIIIKMDAEVASDLGAGSGSDSETGQDAVMVVDAEMETRTLMPDPVGVEAGSVEVLRLSTTEPIGFNGDTRGRRFATSAACSACHSNHFAATAMRDRAGANIAPFNLWQGTMMANAARDPLWHAQVSAETQANPEHSAEIEAKCIRCHSPMASVNALEAGEQPSMDTLYDHGSVDAIVGLDGVACAVCHQIEKSNLGQDDSFSGGYRINQERKIFGPHRDPAPGPMINHVDYTPTWGMHVTKAELCGTCHTLFTTPIRADGTRVEGVKFPEQTTFLEWRNSAYAGRELTCQGCHMPTTETGSDEPIETRIARSPPGGDFFIDPRKPFGKHLFVGGNTLMPQIFINERATLNPQATDEAFEETKNNALAYLQEYAMRGHLVDSSIEDGMGTFTVRIQNLAGHKFPTGMPIRRAWVRVVVSNEDDETIFKSGDFNEMGRLVDHRGAVLDIEKIGGGYEKHHDVITKPDQVQVYEAIMHDDDGEQTYGLMRATGYLKDNRLLPLGYSDASEDHAHTQPYGVDDDNFTAAEDSVTYRFPLRGATRIQVRFEVFFQSVSARYVRELFQVDTPQVKAFRTMYERADLTPVSTVSMDFSIE
jgi:hypothetical protein